MLCNEFRDLVFERLSGELDPQQDAACSAHEKSCAACRAHVAEFRAITIKLRAGWPSEDPLPLSVVVPQSAARNWFDVSALWFSRASAGLVAASLLFLVLVRPSIQVGRTGLQMAFSAPVTQSQTANAGVDQAQLNAMVQAAVDKQMTQVKPVSAAAAPAVDVSQVANEVRQLRQSEATLWQAVQQHSLYLDTLWRNTSDGAVRPASLSR